MRVNSLMLIVLICGALALLSGCGGGGGKAAGGTGSISISVVFPPQDDGADPGELPTATNSVKIRVLTNNPPEPQTLFKEIVLTRGAGPGPVRATITEVPVGNYIVQAFGYVSTDGTGQVIAKAEAPAVVQMGQTTTVNLVTRALTVRVTVTPCTALLEIFSVVDLIATAYDADNNVILGATFDWDTTNHTVATVTTDGQLSTLAEGTCTVSATEQETNVKGNCSFTVYRRHVSYVTVTPNAADLKPPVTPDIPLTAKAYDSSDVEVPYATFTWSTADNNIADVDNAGLVTSTATTRGPHNVVITADAGEGTPGTADITVIPVGEIEVIVTQH